MASCLWLISHGSCLMPSALWVMPYVLCLIPYALCLMPYTLCLNILNKIGYKKTKYSLVAPAPSQPVPLNENFTTCLRVKQTVTEIVILIAYGLWLIAYGLWFMASGLWLITCGFCLMPYALCLIPYALWLMAYGLSLMPYALCLMPYALWLWLVAHGLCLLPYALYLMPYALCLMLYALSHSILHKIGYKKTTNSLAPPVPSQPAQPTKNFTPCLRVKQAILEIVIFFAALFFLFYFLSFLWSFHPWPKVNFKTR